MYSREEKEILKDEKVKISDSYNEFRLKKEILDLEYIVNFKEKYKNNLISVNDDKILNLIIISKNKEIPIYITNKIIKMQEDSFISVNEYKAFRKDIIENKDEKTKELLGLLIR